MGNLQMDVKVARASIGRGKRVICNFAELLCTGYTTSLRKQASSYLDRLTTVLDDAQARVEFLGGFRVQVGEDGHSLHIGNEDSDEERGGQTLPSEGNDPRHDDVVMPPSAVPSYLSGVSLLAFPSSPLFSIK